MTQSKQYFYNENDFVPYLCGADNKIYYCLFQHGLNGLGSANCVVRVFSCFCTELYASLLQNSRTDILAALHCSNTNKLEGAFVLLSLHSNFLPSPSLLCLSPSFVF